MAGGSPVLGTITSQCSDQLSYLFAQYVSKCTKVLWYPACTRRGEVPYALCWICYMKCCSFLSVVMVVSMCVRNTFQGLCAMLLTILSLLVQASVRHHRATLHYCLGIAGDVTGKEAATVWTRGLPTGPHGTQSILTVYVTDGPSMSPE